MLYILRFEQETSKVQGILEFLAASGIVETQPALAAAADRILSYAGAER
jgi:hypothetical protein